MLRAPWSNHTPDIASRVPSGCRDTPPSTSTGCVCRATVSSAAQTWCSTLLVSTVIGAVVAAETARSLASPGDWPMAPTADADSSWARACPAWARASAAWASARPA
ncbi:hypothetical protein [Ornithinimicrobium kibberense]|uniref:hypothetical protein n=1 Tax=Ornithinimicrobium kibberense TaxID=282060 RepID=UPI0036183BFD